MIRREPFGNQMRRDFVADADIEVEAFAAHVDETVEQIEPHAQLRIPLGEPGQRGRDETAAKAEAAGDAQLAAGNAARGGDVFHQLVDVVENLFGPGVDAFTGLRNRDAPRGTVQ